MGEKSWHLEFDGYGGVFTSDDSGSLMMPARTQVGGTHALLAFPKDSFHRSFRDFVIEMEFSLEAQLRKPKPNPWESLWVFFNYQKRPYGEKSTNYIAFKTNGMELGIAKKRVAQTFLKTDNSFKVAPGRSYRFRIVRKGNSLRVFESSKEIFSWTDSAEGQLLQHPGGVGVYVEDALVHVKTFKVRGI